MPQTSEARFNPKTDDDKAGVNGWSFAQSILFGMGRRRRRPPQQTLRVIASGLSRTGTMSIRSALREYDVQCFHTIDLLRFNMQQDFLRAVPPKADAMLTVFVGKILSLGYDCTIDLLWPFSTRLARMYPRAKILHAERTTEEEWYASWAEIQDTFLAIGARPFKYSLDFSWHLESIRQLTSFKRYATPTYDIIVSHPLPWVDILRCNHSVSKPAWIKVYREQARAMEALPNDFLRYNVIEGYDPLTAFLGRNRSLPHAADADASLGPVTNVSAGLPRTNRAVNFHGVRDALVWCSILYPFPLVLWFSLCCLCALQKRARRNRKGQRALYLRELQDNTR